MTGKEFKIFLKNNGITQELAAEILKTSRRTINLWCKMEGNITEKRNIEQVLKSYLEARDGSKNEILLPKNENNLEINRLFAIMENQSNTILSQEQTIKWLREKNDFWRRS